jgi:hypothetical protein
MADRSRYRSVFWPILLIGVGVIWLLGNLGVISTLNFGGLFRLWPLILIAIGLDILIGRLNPILSALIGIGTVAIFVVLLILSPSLNLGGEAELKSDIFTARIGEATSATVSLDFSSAPVNLTALEDSNNLIEADLTYYGNIEFDVDGERTKRISLQRTLNSPGLTSQFDQNQEKWEIGLAPNIPLDLNVDVGSGVVDLDLTALEILDLKIDGSSGKAEVTMPAGGKYDAKIDIGSGSFDVTFSDEVEAELEIDGGSGSMTVNVPDDAAVRVKVLDSGSGNVRLPSGFDLIIRGDDDMGTWETAGFENSPLQIVIVVNDLGSGSITVR